MGAARLLAKGWVLVCLFAGAHAICDIVASGTDVLSALPHILICLVLFLAMGLLFAGGFGVSSGHVPLKFHAPHFVPGFNEAVFLAFVGLSFVDQIAFAPAHLDGPVIRALEAALAFAIPGQRDLVDKLGECGLDGGRVFSSAFAWLLAAIFLSSALSRLRLTAGIIRLERLKRPEALGEVMLPFVLGVMALFSIQLFLMGTVFAWMPCSYFTGLAGSLVVGLAPLMLAYLTLAALATLLASGKEK